MRNYYLLAAWMLAASPAYAQQSSPVNEAVASDIGRLVIQLNTLQVERNVLQARVKELEDKYEPKPAQGK